MFICAIFISDSKIQISDKYFKLFKEQISTSLIILTEYTIFCKQGLCLTDSNGVIF